MLQKLEDLRSHFRRVCFGQRVYLQEQVRFRSGIGPFASCISPNSRGIAFVIALGYFQVRRARGKRNKAPRTSAIERAPGLGDEQISKESAAIYLF